MSRAGLLDVLLVVGKGFTVMGDVFGAGCLQKLKGGTEWQEELMLCVASI